MQQLLVLVFYWGNQRDFSGSLYFTKVEVGIVISFTTEKGWQGEQSGHYIERFIDLNAFMSLIYDVYLSVFFSKITQPSFDSSLNRRQSVLFWVPSDSVLVWSSNSFSFSTNISSCMDHFFENREKETDPLDRKKGRFFNTIHERRAILKSFCALSMLLANCCPICG